jgi:hypothetical protein
MLSQLKKKTADGFSTNDEISGTLSSVFVRQVFFALAFFILALVLQPDLFGLVPNSLDPMFYTGYSINLDDALAAAGNRHYFVTRWSSYLPQYLSTQLFGPYWGRITLRLLMLSILSEVMWRVGKRFQFSALTRLVTTLLVFLSPMFVRSFTTDYTEYSVAFYGTLLVALVVTQPFSAKWAAAFGGLAALLVISNPFTIAMTGIAGLAWTIKQQRFRQLPKLLGLVALTGTSFLAVFIFGYLLFRFHYQIGNVYEPSLDFIKNAPVPVVDLWTAPSNSWLWHFGWLYIPLILVLASHFLVRPDDVAAQKIKFWTQAIVVFVFVAHVYTQISRGHALETSFYWSMALPPVYILLFIVIGQFIERAKRFHTGLFCLAILVLLVFFEVPQKLPLGAGVALVLGLSAFVGGLFLLNFRMKALLAPALVVCLLWMQIGSPAYSQPTYGGDFNTPRYDLVFGSETELSKRIWEETIWFTQQMDRVEDDWKSTFLGSGDWSDAIVGTYIPHPFSRWITAQSESSPLPPNVHDELEFGYRKLLVVYGNQSTVAKRLTRIRSQMPRAKIVFDEVHSKGLRYRLVVLAGSGGEYGKAQIPLSRLDRNLGIPNNDGSVTVAAGSAAGFASFGPYFGLGQGRYKATLHYQTRGIGKVGEFQVFNDLTLKWNSIELESSKPGDQVSAVNFEVSADDATWQLRTIYTGKIEATFMHITLERLEKDG